MLCYDTMAASLTECPDLPLYYADFSVFFFWNSSFKYRKTDNVWLVCLSMGRAGSTIH